MAKRSCGTQVFGAYKALPLGSVLARIANKIPIERKTDKKKRLPRAMKPHPQSRRFTDDQVREIRAARAKGVTSGALSKKYGCRWTAIENIVTGLSYRDIK